MTTQVVDTSSAKTYIIPGRVSNHDSFLRHYAPLLTDVEQGPRVRLVGLEVTAERRPKWSQGEMIVVKILHASVYIASHKTPAEEPYHHEANRPLQMQLQLTDTAY